MDRNEAGRNVLIENLPAKATTTTLLAHLVQQGFEASFEELWLPRDRGSGLSKGYCFLRFPTAELAAAYREKAGHKTLDGSTKELHMSTAPFEGSFPHTKMCGRGYGSVLLRREVHVEECQLI